MKKESFVIYKSFYAPIEALSREEKGELLEAIFEYQISGIEKQLSPHVHMAFCFFKNQFLLDEKKYQEAVEKNRENGKKGGRPKKSQQNPKNPLGLNKPKKADKDNDKDNDKEKENDIDALFDKFYTAYPLKKSRQAAAKSFAKVIKTTPFDEIMAGLESYKEEISKKGTTAEYIKHPSTWLNNACWQDEYDTGHAVEKISKEQEMHGRYKKLRFDRDRRGIDLTAQEEEFMAKYEVKYPEKREELNKLWAFNV